MIPASGDGVLPQIVERISVLRVAFAAVGGVLEPGRITVSPRRSGR